KASDVGMSGSGKSIIPLLKRPSKVNSFTAYNAGNVTVEPESMYISLAFLYTSILDDKLVIKNKTTGDVFEYLKPQTRRNLRLDGMNVTMAGIQAFRDTNKRFIRLAPGVNEFEVTGGVFEQATIDFKYYYK